MRQTSTSAQRLRSSGSQTRWPQPWPSSLTARRSDAELRTDTCLFDHIVPKSSHRLSFSLTFLLSTLAGEADTRRGDRRACESMTVENRGGITCTGDGVWYCCRAISGVRSEFRAGLLTIRLFRYVCISNRGDTAVIDVQTFVCAGRMGVTAATSDLAAMCPSRRMRSSDTGSSR